MISKGFFLYQSNELELLARKAVAVNRSIFKGNLLKKNMAVVQTPGMGRWFSLKTAEISGICANIDLVLPGKFISNISENILRMDYADPFFDTPNLKWFVYELLSSDFINRPEMKTVRNYIGTDDVRRYQISGKIADLFDQYPVFRPEIIAKWKEGALFYKKDKDEIWQKEIYHEIISFKPSELDKLAFLDEFKKRVSSVDPLRTDIPKGVVLFGISTMTEYQLEMFTALSDIMEVHLFHVNPCQDFWGDIVPVKYLDSETFIYETKNRILSEFGFSGKNFHNLLAGFEGPQTDLFPQTSRINTILQKIQDDIRLCIDPDPVEMKEKYDGSVIINGCWGKMREIEVLKETLLDLFDSNRGLLPRDIIVMAPQIEEYADIIEAVFSFDQSENTIPFSVADRSLKNESGIIESFLKILKLDETNFSATEILSIFENRFIHRNFGVEKEDVEEIRKAVISAGVKWGIDKFWRRSKGYHDFEQNSWRFGIDRLLLGYAVKGQGVDTFAGILPFDGIEGETARIIGRFLSFIDVIFEFKNEFFEKRTLQQWEDRLNGLLDALIMDNIETASTKIYLKNATHQLSQNGIRGELKTKVPLSVVTEYLDEFVSNSGFGRGFINGNVTFCSLKPMRSIPFKIVALIGMNDESFPRDNTSLAFDLVSKYPKSTDRFVKENDKYLFLEALLSAKEKLIISYTAKSLSDSSKNFPATPVESLKNYITEKYGVKNDVIEKLHPLQPFNPKYFERDDRFFSFSKKDAAAAKFFTSSDKESDEKHDIVIDLSKLDEKRKKKIFEITPQNLLAFFANPQKYFFSNTLDVQFPYLSEEPDDLEVFNFDNLSAYSIKNEYIQMMTDGFTKKDFKTKLRGEGTVPHGTAGRILIDQVVSQMPLFLTKLTQLKEGDDPFEVPIDLSFKFPDGIVKIKGKLDSVYKHRQLLFRPAKEPRDKDRVKGLLMHLMLNSSEVMKETVFCFLESDLVFAPAKNCFEELSELVEIYLEGMKKVPMFNPWIAEKIFSESKDRSDDVEIFEAMLEKIDDEYAGLKPDIYFDFAAMTTGFYNSSELMIGDICKKSRIIFKKIKAMSGEIK